MMGEDETLVFLLPPRNLSDILTARDGQFVTDFSQALNGKCTLIGASGSTLYGWNFIVWALQNWNYVSSVSQLPPWNHSVSLVGKLTVANFFLRCTSVKNARASGDSAKHTTAGIIFAVFIMEMAKRWVSASSIQRYWPIGGQSVANFHQRPSVTNAHRSAGINNGTANIFRVNLFVCRLSTVRLRRRKRLTLLTSPILLDVQPIGAQQLAFTRLEALQQISQERYL